MWSARASHALRVSSYSPRRFHTRSEPFLTEPQGGSCTQALTTTITEEGYKIFHVSDQQRVIYTEAVPCARQLGVSASRLKALKLYLDLPLLSKQRKICSGLNNV